MVFRRYAVLGENLVIADERVAQVYMRMIKIAHVDISIGKILFAQVERQSLPNGLGSGTCRKMCLRFLSVASSLLVRT